MARNAEILGLATIATLGALALARRGARSSVTRSSDSARPVHWAAALLALSSLADSAVEHYRGSFHNKAMYVPLAVSAATLVASVRDAAVSRERSGSGVIDNLALASGVVGTGFHLYNIGKRPGRFSWLNLFYAAPLGAPAALALAGLLRKVGGWLGSGRPFCGQSPAKLLAGLVTLGLVGSSAEAGLLHFRGAYRNPAMVVPITVPPLAAALLTRAAMTPRQAHPAARWTLRVLAGVGLLGSAFHAYGIQRNMGGWRNWSQNVLNGPPLPAPPAFTALALAGLAALRFLERHDA